MEKIITTQFAGGDDDKGGCGCGKHHDDLELISAQNIGQLEGCC